ncbi:MAG: exodeoxyribonuclease VII large subunit [Clostridia bacterium]|nr:exodeoxyribonuclease VII large subunit [Clostridia bacterium]
MLIASDDVLSAVAIRGEISNFKRHTSGHLYFTLKDSGAEISAVMFRGDTGRLTFNPSDGMKVVVYGNIDVYEKTGKYQVYVRNMIADGVGAMAEAYERLKRKLEAEGLFAEERKRPLPRFPQCIGVITASTGAAIRDILNITGRRYPQAKILIYPSLVQGVDAPASLCMGLEMLNAYGECDVIIIGRGGGSIEDLWAFNDERLVRTVAASAVPVISAVGHETDFTLCDFASDRRAPTPSAAAEIATPDAAALLSYTQSARERLDKDIDTVIKVRGQKLGQTENALSARSPEARLSYMRKELEHKKERMDTSVDRLRDRRTSEYRALVEKLDALNPLRVLQRGYSAVKDGDGRVIGSVGELSEGQRVTVIMSDGRAEAEIISVEENEDSGGRTDAC